MEILAVVLFAVAAVLGVLMAVQRFGGRDTPTMGVALAHGVFAAVALVLAGAAFLAADALEGVAFWSIGLFVVAAVGGAVLFFGFHLRDRPLPVGLVLVHGAAAVVAFLLLVSVVFL